MPRLQRSSWQEFYELLRVRMEPRHVARYRRSHGFVCALGDGVAVVHGCLILNCGGLVVGIDSSPPYSFGKGTREPGVLQTGKSKPQKRSLEIQRKPACISSIWSWIEPDIRRESLSFILRRSFGQGKAIRIGCA